MKKLIVVILASMFPLMASAATEGNAADQKETDVKTTTSQGEVAPADLPENGPSGNLKETVSRSMLLFKPSEEIDVDRPVDFPTNI